MNEKIMKCLIMITGTGGTCRSAISMIALELSRKGNQPLTSLLI